MVFSRNTLILTRFTSLPILTEKNFLALPLFRLGFVTIRLFNLSKVTGVKNRQDWVLLFPTTVPTVLATTFKR